MKMGSRNIARRAFLAGVAITVLAVLFEITWPTTKVMAQGEGSLPAFVQELHHDVSPPLRDMEPKIPPRGPAHQIPLLHPPQQAGPGGLYADPALQTTLGPSVSTTAGLGFDGVGVGLGNYSPNVAPPDTNGAAGATQFVQWVNLSFAVFDKTSGSLIYGPAAGNTIWSGFGGACQNTNDGDVIAQYDKAANRWVMAQLSYSQAPPFLLCLAVSTSSDATGNYNRYSFSYSGILNDYPKLGIWPDGYYVTANMFKPRGFFGYTYQGPEVCAFDRNSMRSGGPANPICRTLSSSYGSLLPADLDGSNPPPGGSPNYLLSLGGSNSLYLWKFKPDFTNGTSTLSGPTAITVFSYNQACGGGVCIPQSGTSQQLDSLGDRLMYRLAYRNQGGTEILLANHSVATTVSGSSTVGVRWYEIHNPNGTPTVYQQSTWAPDATYRWMGSIAMDHVGNIALGYSASSSSIHPAIRYTGRQAGDALNTLQSENSIIEGTGSQTVNLERWGDYSSMSIDPVDDCTLWYTTEYIKSNGTFNWSTRVASFKFSSCSGGTPTPDFSIASSPTSQTVTQGTDALYDITASSLYTFSGTVNLLVTSCPAPLACNLSSGSVDVPSGGTSSPDTLTISQTGTASGNYDIAVQGTGGSQTHSITVHLTVNAPAAGDFSISATPGSLTLKTGQSSSYTVAITPSNGFNSNVTVTGDCPTNFACGFGTAGNYSTIISGGSGSAAYTVTNNGALKGTNTIVNFTASGGGISHSTSVGLKSR